MPTNGHDPSSQTDFSPRTSALTHPFGHVFSSRTPALRAASARPSAVRPDGLGDARGSFSQTPVVRPVVPVDGKRPRSGGWQDKGALGSAPQGTSQPGPDTRVARSSVSDTGSPRSQNHSDAKERLVKGAVWMKPGVNLTLRQLAKSANMSFSAVCAEGLEVYARAKIRDQEETLFEPRMQAMVVLENNNGYLTPLSAEELPLFRLSFQQEMLVSFPRIGPGEPGAADGLAVRPSAS